MGVLIEVLFFTHLQIMLFVVNQIHDATEQYEKNYAILLRVGSTRNLTRLLTKLISLKASIVATHLFETG